VTSKALTPDALADRLAKDYLELFSTLEREAVHARAVIHRAVHETRAADGLFARAAQLYRALELLRLAWPDLPAVALPPPPVPQNLALALFDIDYVAARPLPPLVVAHTANATSEQRRGDELAAVSRYLKTHRREISSEVVDVVKAALGNGGSP